jgi:tetratricopeptide (TPR) repeat protein
MHQDAEAPASSPAVAAADINLDQLSRDLGSEGRWDELVLALIERASTAADVAERIGCLKRASSIYETKLRDPEKAYVTLQAALAEDYRNEEVVRDLERLGHVTGRPRRVIEDYEGLVGQVGDLAQKVALLLRLADWHLQLDEVVSAQEKLDQALAVDPTSIVAVRRLAELLTRREDWPRLAEHLARSGNLVLRPSDNAELLLAGAEVYHRKLKKLPEATALYTRVMELDPGSVQALEGLVEITWQEENWVRALPLLEQMAMAENRSSAERSRICQRAAMAAIRTGDYDRARGHARKVLELDPREGEAFLRDWIDIAYSRQWWPDVRELGEWLQARVSLKLTAAERAELHVRVGRAHLEAGQDEAARDELSRAVKLDPGNRRSRELLVEIYTRLGQPEAALEHQKAIVEKITSPDEKWRLLLEVARTERDVLQDRQGALQAFKKALAIKPHDRSILSDMVELHSELRQWRPASDLLLKLADGEEVGSQGPYLVAAANILHYEVFATDEAIALYERALDENPQDLKTFDRLDKILSSKHAWKDKARAYKRMIKRLGPADDEQKKASLLTLWRGLAELCRTELGDLPTAAAALEVCVKLDPSSLSEQEALAELYEATGPEGLRAAVDRRSYLFERHDDPDVMIRQLKALQRIYTEAGLPDRAYCACAALTVMQAGEPDHVAFYESVAAEELPVPRAALSEEIWQKVLYHPGEERRLSLLFSCVAPVIALTRAQDGRSFRLKDRYRLEAKTDPSGVARLFDLGASVLSVPRPAVYYNQEFTRATEILNLRDPSGNSPTVAVGRTLLEGRVERDIAFIVGRTLALMRPDHLVLSPNVVQSTSELAAIVHAAYKLCEPNAPVPNPEAYRPFLNLFERMLPPQALEPLSSLAPWLSETWRTLDLEAWRAAAEHTANRAGLLFCGDLGAAVRVLHATRGEAAGGEVLDLMRWSVSEGHLGLREMLGIADTIAGATVDKS